jgi:BioD-like phosphotransacetylase family protein
MGAQNARSHFRPGVLLITPGDREDIIQAASSSMAEPPDERMAGIVLTGNLHPAASVLKLIRSMPIPVLFTEEDSYLVASKVHDLTVKTRPSDAGKISLIRDLINKHVDLGKILKAL